MKNRFTTLFYVIVVTTVTCFSCKKTDTVSLLPKTNPLEQKVTASIHGRVVDENSKPVADASIQSGSYITTTDINGVFRFTNILLSKNAGFVLVEKSGYFHSGRTIFTSEGVVNNIEIKLIPKKERGNFQASEGGNISIQSGAAVNFPISGVVNKSNNTQYAGAVTVFAAYLDPQDPNFASIMPGNLTGLTINNEQKILQTYGMIVIELEGSNGEKLDLASGKPAVITVPIPSAMQADAPVSIPLWYFNDTLGIWKEEGTAVKQSNTYVGNVSHFSFWSWDVSNDFVNLNVTLKNQAQELLSGYRVSLRNTQNNSISNGYTDSSGTVNGAIPPGVLLEMMVYDKCNSIIHTQAIGPFTTPTDLGVVTIIIPATASINVSGTVMKCNLAPVTNGVVDFLLEGLSYRTVISNGSFSINIQRCSGAPASLTAIAMDSDTNEQSSVISLNVTSGNYTTNIKACGISAQQFIICKIGSDTFNFIPANDTLGSFRYSGDNITEITASRKYQTDSQPDPINFQFISFKFTGPEAPGTYNTNFILLFRGSPSYLEYLIDNPMAITITEYGNIGEFVAGTFTGIMRERLAILLYQAPVVLE